MGWCHEFGPQIQEGCSHPMVAGRSSCGCQKCLAVCTGKFNGCAAVWERGPVAHAPRLLEPAVLAEARPVPEPDRWQFATPDFTVRAEPVPPTEPEPVTAPVPVPVSVAPVVPAPSKPRRRLEMASHAPGLSQLRDRLDGLRGELTSLGEALGTRAQNRRSRSVDSG